MGFKVDKKQKQVLRALIDTFVAPLDDDEALALVQCHHTTQPLVDEDTTAVDYSALATFAGNDIDRVMETALVWLEHAVPPVLRTAVLTKLQSLHNGWWFRKQRYAFLNVPRQQKEAAVLKWKGTSRAVFRVLSAMVLSTVYGYAPSSLRQSMGFVPPIQPPVGDPYRMLTLYEAQVLQAITFDVIVVGSGAGAGVIASQVASVGESVLIIEKGKYFKTEELDPTNEMDAMTKMYDGNGVQYNKTGSVSFMAASTLGGGTSVDYSIALDPPQMMLDEWVETSGDVFDATLFKRDLATVKSRIGVTNKGIKHNKANKILKEGCAKLGVTAMDCPNSTRDFSPAHQGNKKTPSRPHHGTANTWLRDAEAYGARVMDQTEVTKILIKDGKAVGVECHDKKSKTTFTYNSKIVVVAGGGLHTPALLKKSGLKNKHIGRHLKLHPTIYVQGYYTEPIDISGAVTTAISHVPADASGSSAHLLQSNGTRIQVAHMPPAFSAMVFPWRGALAHKQSMAKHRYAVPFQISATDTGDQQDDSVHGWKLAKQDETALLNGVIRACRILAVTGASQLESSQLDMDAFHFDDTKGGLDAVKDTKFNIWLEQVRNTGVPDGIYSMHQMGTCRMAKHPNKGVTKITGETWEVKHLYVADASLFMTASGVDPLLTIETLAYGVARNVITRLGKSSWS